MGILVRISALAPDDAIRDFGAGALMRVEHSTTEAGTYTEIGTKLVEAETFSYELWHAAGNPTDWYQTRFSTALPTLATHYSGYSDPFSPGAPEAYANLDDLLLTMGQPVNDTRFLANAERRLREATLDLDREIGYSALQVTGTRLVHGEGTGLLHVHGGIVALTGIEIRLSSTDPYIALQAQDTGFILEGDNGNPESVDGVYYHVRLLDAATYTTFPRAYQGVRLSGTFGGNAESRRAACVAWARQRISLDPSTPGGLMSGPEDLGAPISFDKWPRAVYDLVANERHRFWCHV